MKERRRHARVKKRVSCTIISGGRRYTGVCLDVSPQGVFVQTSAKLDPGTTVDLELGIGPEEALQMQARVARSKLVPAELRSIAKGGLGLHIDLPPEEYFRFYAKLSGTDLTGGPNERRRAPRCDEDQDKTSAEAGISAKPKKKKLPPRMAPPQPKLRYRVRLAQVSGGTRTRSVTVECNTIDDARDRALQTVDGDWKVLKIDPV